MRPGRAEKWLEVSVTDADGVVVKEGPAPNAGAVVQADGLRFANGGEVSVRVANNHLKSSSVEVESEYSLELTEAGGAAVGTAKAETPTPAPPGAAPTGGRSLLQTVTSFALWTLLPFVVGLVLGTIVGFLLGRRRR